MGRKALNPQVVTLRLSRELCEEVRLISVREAENESNIYRRLLWAGIKADKELRDDVNSSSARHYAVSYEINESVSLVMVWRQLFISVRAYDAADAAEQVRIIAAEKHAKDPKYVRIVKVEPN